LAIEHFDPDRFAFLFDVDGTLIDIAPTPDAVQVPMTLRRNLGRLQILAGGAVALVSGRALADLDFLFSPLELTVIGGHGAEVRLWTNGKAERHGVAPLDPSVKHRLGRIAAESDKVILEDKGYSVALHYRLAPNRQQAIMDAVEAVCEEAKANEIEVLHGKFVVEVKRAGFNKGTGVGALMQKAPFNGRRPIFVGDDITDEDAFAAVHDLDGIAISVGRLVKGVERRFEAPADVRRWIEDLCETDAKQN
jgi:trehalose 6-phosphate phosphatase